MRRLRQVGVLLVLLLIVKLLASIVSEYRWYFPPNFDAAFLIGREELFRGYYAAAFYAHILSGPPTILLGLLLLSSGMRARFRRLHRILGRTQAALVLGVLVPSGLVMSLHVVAGPWAGLGFSMLALATGGAMVKATLHAIGGRYADHRRWAERCLVLLLSPLALRVANGAISVTSWESPTTYILSAWLSWVLPLVALEMIRHASRKKRPARPNTAMSFIPKANRR